MTKNQEEFCNIMFDLFDEAGGAEAFLREFAKDKAPFKFRKARKTMIKATRRYIFYKKGRSKHVQ
jgi:hypothetical protein